LPRKNSSRGKALSLDTVAQVSTCPKTLQNMPDAHARPGALSGHDPGAAILIHVSFHYPSLRTDMKM
jgi:hypothetical protein